MARIPRIPLDPAPSGTPELEGEIPTPFAEIAETAGDIADIAGAVGKGFSAEERREALRQRAIREAKQNLVNEVTALRMGGEVVAEFAGFSKRAKDIHFDDPENAIERFTKTARLGLDAKIKNAPNTAVALSIARTGAARSAAAIRDLNAWVDLRQTQKAKNEVVELSNLTMRGAEDLGTTQALTEYLNTSRAALGRGFQIAHGPKADEKMRELLNDTAVSFFNAQIDGLNPLAAAQMLDEKDGPAARFLTGAQRKTLRAGAKAAFGGLAKRRDFEEIKTGMIHNQEIHASFMNGDRELGAAILASERAIDKKRKALVFDDSLDDAAKARQNAIFDKRLRYLDAVKNFRRRQFGFDAEDDVGSVSKLLRQREELFKQEKGKKGKDLTRWIDFQTDLAVAFSDRKISQSTYNAMFKEMSLALGKGLEVESDNTGWNFGFFDWRSPRQAGNHELNRRFSTGEFKNLSADDQAKVRLAYIEQLNTHAESGATLTERQARKFAAKALSIETGIGIPGALD